MTWEECSVKNKIDKLKTKFKNVVLQKTAVENKKISHRVEKGYMWNIDKRLVSRIHKGGV